MVLDWLRFLELDVIAFANMWLYSISTSAPRFPPLAPNQLCLLINRFLALTSDFHHLFKYSHHHRHHHHHHHHHHHYNYHHHHHPFKYSHYNPPSLALRANLWGKKIVSAFVTCLISNMYLVLNFLRFIPVHNPPNVMLRFQWETVEQRLLIFY